MKKQSKKNRINSVVIGVIVGVLTPFAIVPLSHSANAAILVQDTANIAKTVEIVTNTVTMINHMVSEVELLGKSIQSMDAESAIKILQDLNQQQQRATAMHEEIKGIGSKINEVGAIWQTDIGVAQDILSGKVAPGDINEIATKHHELTYKNTTDAARVAKAAQHNNEQINKNVNTVLEASQKAEGPTSAVQANTAMLVQNTQAIMQNTELLSQLVQLEATKQGMEDANNAIGERMWDIVVQNNANADPYEDE